MDIYRKIFDRWRRSRRTVSQLLWLPSLHVDSRCHAAKFRLYIKQLIVQVTHRCCPFRKIEDLDASSRQLQALYRSLAGAYF